MVSEVRYEESSFLAGISVGRELKGWAAFDEQYGFQGGELSHITVRSQPTTFVEVPADGFYGIGSVTVEGDENLVPSNIKAGVKILGVEGSYVPVTPSDPVMVAKSVTISENGTFTFYPGSGNTGMSRLTATVNVPTVEEVVDATFQTKNVTPGYSSQTITPDDEYDGLSSVYVYGDNDLVESNIKKGITIFGVTGTYEKTELVDAIFQHKNVTPRKSPQTIYPDSNYDGLSSVYVGGDANLIASNIREGVRIFGVDGSYSSGTVYQDKKETPRKSDFTVTADDGYNALASVTISGDKNLTPENIADGVTIFGVTGTYVSPMKHITVIPSLDEQLILPAQGCCGFSSITVPPAEATGDYNEGFAAGVTSRDTEVTELLAQIEILTAERDSAYENGYSAGYDAGAADIAASYTDLDEEEF